jgi:uncharacterized protein (UPF0332 family)
MGPSQYTVRILFDYNDCLKKRLIRKITPSNLYSDGYREKSHACVARYLEANYVRKGHLEQKWVELLDHFREIRHSDQYSFNFFTSTEEVEDTIDKSKAFVTRMKNLLEVKSKI